VAGILALAGEYSSVKGKSMRRRETLLALAASLVPSIAWAQQSRPQQSGWVKQHRVVIQIDQEDPKAINLALNNAANMKEYWDKKDEKSQIEFVAFGPGLVMMRSDTSPVRERIAELAKKGVVFSGCGNTRTNQSKAESRQVELLSDVREVPTGVARITELEEQGWTYLRP
jgi:intracellular sulfur oxidation DsrE/DsrF family protein